MFVRRFEVGRGVRTFFGCLVCRAVLLRWGGGFVWCVVVWYVVVRDRDVGCVRVPTMCPRGEGVRDVG
jgi:hypothetical protein